MSVEPCWHTRPLAAGVLLDHEWQAMDGGVPLGPPRMWQVDAIKDLAEHTNIKVDYERGTYSVLGGRYGAAKCVSDFALFAMRRLGDPRTEENLQT